MSVSAAGMSVSARSAPNGALSGRPSASGSASSRGRSYMSIGRVLAALRPEFPEVTISKIRFLESEGLVEPERTPSGYRKFSREDLARLTYVLTAQRDHYLPLRVIKDNLAALDRGLQPAASPATGPTVPRTLAAVDGLPTADDFLPEATELRLSRAELLAAAKITDEQLSTLEQYGLITRGGTYFDRTALVIAQTVGSMAQFGIEARHLRAFKTAAEREIGLVEQVISPLLGQKTAEARTRAEQTARELAALSVALHAALVRAGLGPALTR
jgi:DNA-binding transcriptional MerR regulator